MDEDGATHSVIAYTLEADPSVFVTLDSSYLLSVLDDALSDLPPVTVTKRDGTVEYVPPWNYKLVRTGNREETGRAERVRLDRFGCRMDGRRRQAMHLVWSPGEMSPSGDVSYLGGAKLDELMAWAVDFRQFHMDNNMPLSTTFSGVAAKLLRDARFYPDARRQVPRATNERAREFLPGVYQESRAKSNRKYNGVSLDQSKAYHMIAQEVPLPDSNTLFARGYFPDPFAADMYWCEPGDELYARTVAQPGLIFIGAHSTIKGKSKPFIPPAMDFHGFRKIAVWTNELPMMQELGLQVEGVYAALTSTLRDEGIRKYGAYALSAILGADAMRASWLKPTLHAAYGILGARPRHIRMGFKHGKGDRMDYILGARVFNVAHVETRQKLQPPTANVVQLGVLQSEVRRRTLALANALRDCGVEVTHVHADGLHAMGQLPLTVPNSWTAAPVSNLKYIDRVSWTSDQGDCLPGRSRKVIQQRRHRAYVLANRKR